MRLREDLGVGRVRDLAVERDHPAVVRLRPRRALPRRRGGWPPPRRSATSAARAACRRRAAAASRRLGLRDLDLQVALAAELGDRRLGIVERLAVEAGLVLDGRDALALERAGDDDRRPAGGLERLGVGAVDRLHVVAVDLDRVPAERLGSLHVDVGVPAEHGLAALAEPVDVEDRRQVVELVVGGVLERLPDRALGRLAVAVQDPDTGRQPARGACAPSAMPTPIGSPWPSEPVATSTHGITGVGCPSRRLPCCRYVSSSVVVDRAGGAVDRVEQRRRVPLREDELVVPRVVRPVEVVAEVLGDEHRHQVGCRHPRAGMPGFRGGSGADGVHPELLTELAPELDVVHACNVTICW